MPNGLRTDTAITKTGTAMAIPAAPMPPALHEQDRQTNNLLVYNPPCRLLFTLTYGLLPSVLLRVNHRNVNCKVSVAIRPYTTLYIIEY